MAFKPKHPIDTRKSLKIIAKFTQKSVNISGEQAN